MNQGKEKLGEVEKRPQPRLALWGLGLGFSDEAKLGEEAFQFGNFFSFT